MLIKRQNRIMFFVITYHLCRKDMERQLPLTSDLLPVGIILQAR